MRGLRWGATFVLGVSVFALTGCAGYKIVKLEEYEELRRAERLNTTQQGIISDLTHHNEQLQLEIKSLKGRLTDKEAYIASVEEELARLRTELTPSAGTETVPQLPGFDVGLEPEGLGIGVGSDVLFDTGKATLKPEGRAALDRIVPILTGDKYGSRKIRIAGFTDSVWTGRNRQFASNFDLSGARALSVLNYLEEKGIAPARLHFSGYGEYQLVTSPDGSENKTKSRRVKVIILYDWATRVAEQVPADVTPQ